MRVYEYEYDEDEDYSRSDYNQYIIKVENTEDEINLSSLKLNSRYINFNKDDISYELNAASISVQAIPEDEDYTVKINGIIVDEDNDYKRTIPLSKDINIIKITVSDYDNTKTYIFRVVRTGITQGNDDDNWNNGLHNGWRNKNNAGNNGAHNGWRNKNGIWYYLDNNGKIKTGWLKDTDKNWYYLDKEGKMRTSWFKDVDGSWYYLQPSGKMAKNTTIDGYKLGPNGAWMK